MFDLFVFIATILAALSLISALSLLAWCVIDAIRADERWSQ